MGGMPVEPPPSRWVLPDPADPGIDAVADDLVAMGGDLEPGTLLAAYRRGLFPMPARTSIGRRTVGWWSPVDRGVLPVVGHHVSRSLHRSWRRMEIRVDTAFDAVVRGCADPSRPGGWIDRDIRAAYAELHRLGWAHSIETWQHEELVGGLYGVAVGGLFAGESMFHRRTDASKVALVGLVELLSDEYAAQRLVDVQWRTEHLATLGVVDVPRAAYLEALRRTLSVPLPASWR
jgi:leucyl/phenylalanyl-tRNA--protein transferase